MLGRRAAIGAASLVLAATGGGVAYAATHGGASHARPAVKPHVTPKPRTPQRVLPRSGGRCHHDGAMMAPTAAAL
jgi:hypothetical protein